MTTTFSILVPPISLELDGAKVLILEASSYTNLKGEKRYIVSCKIHLKDFTTPVFPLDVASNDELVWKLRAEIAKIKLVMSSGEKL